MKNLVLNLVFLTFTNIIFGQNVMITNAYSPNEPSICMNKNNPNILIAGTNINNVHKSLDGGKTWSNAKLTSTYGVWGDPVIDCDSNGNFYFFHLSNPSSGNWIDRIVCQKTTNSGTSWSTGTYTGLNGTKAQDKHWSIIDSNNNIYLTWTEFDSYGSTATTDHSRIKFSKSTDGGQTWSNAITISSVEGDCEDSDNTVEGAMPAIGPNGEIYVVWAGPNGLVFKKSLDGGTTWSTNEKIITPIGGGWDFGISGIYRANGLPVTKCDLSNGPNRGTIYVNWTDQSKGETNTEVWLTKSQDGGNTWSTPVLVNDDNSGKQQFFTWMDIDQTNGNLAFVFYDRRNYTDDKTDVYMAFSDNGGTSFINKKISESPFLPNEGVFFGDYTNIVIHNNIVRPIWTRLDNSSLSVWTNITPLNSILATEETTVKDNDFTQYPVPVKDIAYISFKLHQRSKVSVEVLDMSGKKVLNVIDNKSLGYGKYIYSIDTKKNNFTTGSYIVRLIVDGKSKILRTIVIH